MTVYELLKTYELVSGFKTKVPKDQYLSIVKDAMGGLPPVQMSAGKRGTVEVLKRLYQEELSGRDVKAPPEEATKDSNTGTGNRTPKRKTPASSKPKTRANTSAKKKQGQRT